MSSDRPQIDEDALTEALTQLVAIDADEEDRRKAADMKIAGAQNALGFTVTLAGGSTAYAFLQSPQYDLWHIMALGSLVIAVVFFLWAAIIIMSASQPRYYQARTAKGILQMLKDRRKKRELQIDAINDLASNIRANLKATDERLNLYMDSQVRIRNAMIAIAIAPTIILVGYVTNAVGGSHLPTWLRIVSTASSASSTPAK